GFVVVDQLTFGCMQLEESSERDVVAQNGEECVDNSPSPKLPHSRTHLALRGLMNSVLGSVDSVPTKSCLCWYIVSKTFSDVREVKIERNKLEKDFFPSFYLLYDREFMAFTPFFSIDVSTILQLNNERFPLSRISS
ncbi:hypothetical protein ACMD2_26099, partial [Ananas comosus]